MANDSLGKKTHLPCTQFLFWNADKIWTSDQAIEPVVAAQALANNETIKRIFHQKEWPTDPRARQAYVHRFFNWLAIPPDERLYFPTRILSASDSVAFRQCLWIDFVNGTPEAQRAIYGLYETLTEEDRVIVSSKNHNVFCEWLDIPNTDNTRRGPFARWLEDVGLAIPLEGRGKGNTAVIVEFEGAQYATTEAFVYGLIVEFGDIYNKGIKNKIRIENFKIKNSITIKSLLINQADIEIFIQRAKGKKYIKASNTSVHVDIFYFCKLLKRMMPFPSQDWIYPDSSIDAPLTREAMLELKIFPEEDCSPTIGSPLGEEGEKEKVTRTKRDQSFPKRVSAAYRNRCCITGLRFRAPTQSVWFGDAAHIIPHSGKDKNGNPVYGKSVISNGIYLSKFMHWCFDKGWITLTPSISKQGRVKNYTVNVATVALDDFFMEERGHVLNYDMLRIKRKFLPENYSVWPSVEALEWHRENIFDG